MPLFREKKTASAHCAGCGHLTNHEKVGENSAVHLPLVFLSCLLWLPVFAVAVALDRSKPWRCVHCGALVRISQPDTATVAGEGGAR